MTDGVLDLVLGKLDGVRKQGGSWMARCPAHEDREASLSIRQGTRQPVILKCHARCKTPDVLAAIGLSVADISAAREPERAGEWMPGGRRSVVVYDYLDERGKLLFQVLRSADKKFSQRRPDSSATSGWIYGLGDTRRVLYRLPKIRKAAAGPVAGRVVWIAEGEKDVQALEAAGVTATCNPGGVGVGWKPAYTKLLAGIREVVIVADRDDQGREHAAKVATSLTGRMAGIRVVEAAEGKDAADHLAAGLGLDDFRPVAWQGLSVPVAGDNRPDVPPGEPDAVDGAIAEAPEAVQPARRLVLTPASDIEPEPVIWAWEDEGKGRIPSGSLGLFAGREGTGKSSFLIWLAAKITTGELPGSFFGTPRGVIYVAVEDSWKYTIVPRLMAAGADLTRVFRAEVRTIEDDAVSLNLPVDNQLLKEAITEYGIALVALDPLMSAISGSLDTHVNREVRQALDPLARMADETGAILAGIAHFSKGSSTDASSLITGSGAFKDVARFIFAFAEDPESDTETKVITQTKNSLGHSGLPSMAYRIIEAIVPTSKGDARVGRFILDGASDKSVGDILRSAGTQDRDQEERADAADYLRTALSGGPRRSREVEDEALHAHGISKRTLERARKELRIAAAQRPSGPKGRDERRKQEWWISLAEHAGDLKTDYVHPDDTPDRHETPDQTATEKALTCADRQTANTAALLEAGGVADGQTAKAATAPGGLAGWRSGGLAVSPGASLTGLPSGAGAAATEALRPACAREPGHEACAQALVGRCVHEAAPEDPGGWAADSVGAAVNE